MRTAVVAGWSEPCGKTAFGKPLSVESPRKASAANKGAVTTV